MPIPAEAAWLAASPVVFGAAGIGGPGSAAWLAVQESKNAPRQAHGIANRPGKARDQVVVIVWQRPKEGGSLIAGALLALWTVSERPSGPAGLAPNPRRVAAGIPGMVAHRGAIGGHARRDWPFTAPGRGP